MEIHDIAVLWIFLVLLTVRDDHITCTCKNGNGQTVDWFIVYKVPTISTHMNPEMTTTGRELLYMDNTSRFFYYKDIDITRPHQNPLYYTLQQIYSRSLAVTEYAMYNDQPPGRLNQKSYAHSKGALAFGSSNGFWMVSSVSKFPAPVANGYEYLTPQLKYGQTILCVTLAKSMKSIIKSVFQTTNPYIYDSEGFTLNAGISSTTYEQRFKTEGNVPLKVFAKSAKFGQDIYELLISPGIDNTNLFVQTWRPNLPNTTKVNNIRYIFFRKNGLSFRTTVDHSKWTVAKNLPWTCIGDINRKV